MKERDIDWGRMSERDIYRYERKRASKSKVYKRNKMIKREWYYT